MSFLDLLKKTASQVTSQPSSHTPSQSPSPSAVSGTHNQAPGAEGASQTFSFSRLPASMEELKALPEAAMQTPYQTAALTVCALCAYAKDAQSGIDMLNFLKGPQPLSQYEIQFLRDRFMDGKNYVPFSYWEGAVPENDYTPSEPFSVTVFSNPYSFTEEGYATLHIRSGGADSPRQVKLRKKSDTWFLWEQFLLPDIRKPKSQDPWA